MKISLNMQGTLYFIKFCMLLLVMGSGCKNDSLEDFEPVEVEECDTSDISFSVDVMPVLETKCNENTCHGGDFPQGGIGLSSYESVSAVDEDRLTGAIRHDEDYQNMPDNAEKLSECDIQKIEAWINQGKPDN